jgi:drug/metabolite transporter (DMT)-like permease
LIMTAVLARVFLKEKLSLAHFVSIMITALGVLFIAKPSGLFPNASSVVASFNSSAAGHYLNNQTIIAIAVKTAKPNIFGIKDETIKLVIGVILAIVSAFTLSCIFLVLKKLNKCKVHWAVSTIYVCWSGIPMSLILSIILIQLKMAHKNFEKESYDLFMDIFYSVMSALVSILGQVLMNIALKYEDATKVSIIFTLGVFVTIVLQYFILGILIDLYSGLGAFFILVGTTFILVFQMIEAKYNKKVAASPQNDKCSISKVVFVRF